VVLKKQNFAEGEIATFDKACVYKRGEYWQFRLWLPKENKYARTSRTFLCRNGQYFERLRDISKPKC
jgi:hypothetical protein